MTGDRPIGGVVADLLVIVPSRGRPHNVAALLSAWADTATGAADLLVALDDDDPTRDDYESLTLPWHWPGNPPLWTVGPRRRLVGTLNNVAALHASEYGSLGFLGDDHRPRSRAWDARFVECLSAGTGVVYGNDLLQRERMPTAVALTSDIVSTLGYMVPPALVHLCADLVWLDWGTALGRITYLPDVILEHLHPAAGKATLDDGYRDANSSERATADAAAYQAYRDGQLADDVAKLRTLL